MSMMWCRCWDLHWRRPYIYILRWLASPCNVAFGICSSNRHDPRLFLYSAIRDAQSMPSLIYHSFDFFSIGLTWYENLYLSRIIWVLVTDLSRNISLPLRLYGYLSVNGTRELVWTYCMYTSECHNLSWLKDENWWLWCDIFADFWDK